MNGEGVNFKSPQIKTGINGRITLGTFGVPSEVSGNYTNKNA